MQNKITISKPTNSFGSAIKETTIGFPAMRLTPPELDIFISQLKEARAKV